MSALDQIVRILKSKLSVNSMNVDIAGMELSVNSGTRQRFVQSSRIIPVMRAQNVSIDTQNVIACIGCEDTVQVEISAYTNI